MALSGRCPGNSLPNNLWHVASYYGVKILDTEEKKEQIRINMSWAIPILSGLMVSTTEKTGRSGFDTVTPHLHR